MESHITEAKKSHIVKEAVLAAGTVLFAFAAGYFWRSIGTIGSRESVFGVSMYLEIAAIFLFAICFIFYSVMYANRIGYGVTLLASSIVLFVSYTFENIFAFGIGSAFIFFLWGSVRIRQETDAQARLHWHSILHAGARKFFIGLAIAFSILFFAILGPSAQLQEAVIPKPVFKAFLPILEKPAQGLIPGFSASATLDEVILDAVMSQVGKDIDVAMLPKAQVQQFIAEQRMGLNRQFGTKFTGKEKVSDVLYLVVSKKLDEYAAPYKQYVPAAVSIGYFITLQFVFFIFSLILSILFPFIVFILIKSGFFERKSVMVEKEIITL